MMKSTLFFLVFLFFIFGCSNHKTLTVPQIENRQSVKLVFQDGTSANAFIVSKENNQLTYIAQSDHQKYTVPVKNIRRVEALNTYLDDLANPISNAEIERVKSNRNTWGYAIGGAVVGGAAGLVVALPFWYNDVKGIPPYFVAGAGAVVGSIYFAFRGQDKDRTIAVETIRYQRKAERELQEQIEREKKQLQKIQETKKELEKKLQEKKKEKE